MVNSGLLAAEIGPVVWGIPANFNGFRVLASLQQRGRSTEANHTLHNVCTYLLVLEVDGLCSRSAEDAHIAPVSIQPVLKALIDGASMTSCGNLFHSLTIRELKKFCLIVV